MRVCVRWRERGSLVCRPQIYDAVTLSEESGVSSAARTRDKRSRFHGVLSFILTSHSAPLIFHFYSNSLVLHHLCSCAFTALCFSQFSSSLETSHTLTNWTKQKVVTSVCWLLRCPTVRVLFILFRAAGKLSQHALGSGCSRLSISRNRWINQNKDFNL